MKDFVITKNAMQLLSKLVLSCCHPLMNVRSNRQHQNTVIFEARKNEDVTFKTFSKSVASNYVLYEKLWLMAERMDKKRVDQEVVINYFGSKMHIDKVMDDLGSSGMLSQEEFMKFIFLHMLVPVTVEEIVGNRTDVVFRKRDTEVRINGVVVLAEDRKKIEIGSCVLTHFTTLIVSDCDKLLRQHLLSKEDKCREFMEAARFFNGQEIAQLKLTENTENLASCFNL